MPFRTGLTIFVRRFSHRQESPITSASDISASDQSPADTTGLKGLRVCSFESRKGSEIRSLIERQGGIATVAPSMREVPLDQNPDAFAFAEKLFAGQIDIMIFMTGVGARGLLEVLETRHSQDAFFAAVQKCKVIVRGPKPASVLREWQVRIDHLVPEPNTWRELLGVLDASVPVDGKQVAVQEYGQPNAEFYGALEHRGARVLPVPVYRWALPEDTAPLRSAIRATIAGETDVLMFTSAQQLHNVLEVADQEGLRDAWLAAAARSVIASIGPTASETLRGEGLPVDIEPEHPKMGHLVVATGRSARGLLESKRK